jgi:hypothetical protein
LKEVGTLINPELNIDTSHVKITDSGDIQEKLELEEAHLLLEERVSQIIKSNSIPFVIGMFFKHLNLNFRWRKRPKLPKCTCTSL